MDFIVTIEDLNINFADINIDPDRLNRITTFLPKKVYQSLHSLFQTNDAAYDNNSLHMPILWISPKEISEDMSDEEISDILSISVVEEIKKRI